MESKNYLDDISEIKQMMSRSSRFISLSGLSGVLAGGYALIGAYFARKVLRQQSADMVATAHVGFDGAVVQQLLLIAAGVIFCAVVSGVLLTLRKSKKSGENLWDVSSKRLVLNFLVPLLTGGVFSLVLIQNGIVGLVAPATLIFYGLACINAGKYTLGDVRYMGMAFVVLGLINTQFIGYGLYFWTMGFGLFHIFYGTLMHFKYDRK